MRRRLLLTLALGGMLFAAAAAAAANPANQASLDRTVRYLQEAQQASGGFGGSGEPSQITSAWTALALAAAGVNPQDQRRETGADAFSYLVANYRQGIEESECAPVACTTQLERELMVVNAAGADPHDFGGVDLVEELLARGRDDGSFPHVPGGGAGVNDTIFAIFALAPLRDPAARTAIESAAGWIEAGQLDNGGWAWLAGGSRDEVDMTGAAIQALVAAGRGRNAAVEAGIGYLRRAQAPDGGFPEFPGNPEPNAASTAWVVQAIWAVGENPESWRGGADQSADPLSFLESLQEPDGHIRWKRGQDVNGIWMTAYSSVALGGHSWPIPAAPRSNPPATAPEPGEGEGGQSGSGVIAGGGGGGAPLFSRPKPQSKGRTPGGARVIRREGGRVANHSRSRRGINREQPTGTATVEATAAAVDPAPKVFAGAGGRGSGGSDGDGSDDPLVTGTLIGATARGEPAFGAPGLDGAGIEDGEVRVAIGIGGLALLLAAGGAGWERRRGEVLQ